MQRTAVLLTINTAKKSEKLLLLNTLNPPEGTLPSLGVRG